MGSAHSTLQLSHPTNPVLLCGSPMAGITDIKPMANLAPFGLCKSLANPTVSAATAAAGGKLQEMPCIPCVTSPWAYGKMNVSVKGQPAITDDSRCVCMWLGIIKVKSAGQKTVIDTAPPLIDAADPQPPASVAATAPEAKGKEAKTAGMPTPPTAQDGAATAKTPKKGLLSSIQTAVAAVIEKVVGTVKDRITAVASSVAAAAIAAVGGIFGLRGKGGDTEKAENAGEEKNVIVPEKCFCNRGIDVDEFEDIVRCLRNVDGRKDLKLFGVKCNVPLEDRTIKRLTEEFNETCKIYGINYCIQKIHFLSQIYWESDHFNTTLEYKDGTGYNPGQHKDAKNMGHTENGDGPRYKGRGLMQLTWRKSQMNYLKHARNKFEILKGLTDADIENRENSFEKLISDTLSGSMDSAGWFWSKGNSISYGRLEDKKRFVEILGKTLNEAALYADKYQEGISINVNGGSNGKSDRARYYNELKKIMKADQCQNQAKIDGDPASRNTGEADKATQTAGDQTPKNTGEAGKATQKTAAKPKTTESGLGELHPTVREKAEKLLALCEENGMSVKVHETIRTVARQDELYAEGRNAKDEKVGKTVTNAQGKEYASYHQWGLAFDIIRADPKAPYNNSDRFFDKLGELGKQLGLKWGGEFKNKDGEIVYDGPHFEDRTLGTITKLKKDWATPEKFIESWKK
jgi:predicted chitinase